MPDETTTAAPASTPAADELDEQTATDVANLRRLLDEIKDRSEQADAIKVRLRERQSAGGRFRYGGRAVLSVGEPGTTFDRKLAAQVIPEPLHASVSTPQLDPEKCARILPPDLYAKCCKPSTQAVKPL